MTNITAEIDGRVYKLAADQDESALRAVAKSADMMIREMRRGLGTHDRLQAAILSLLNALSRCDLLEEELTQLKEHCGNFDDELASYEARLACVEALLEYSCAAAKEDKRAIVTAREAQLSDEHSLPKRRPAKRKAKAKNEPSQYTQLSLF